MQHHYLRIFNRMLGRGDVAGAKQLLISWIRSSFQDQGIKRDISAFRNTQLWWSVGRYHSLYGDREPADLLMRELTQVPLTAGFDSPLTRWPVVGVPVLNRPDLLKRLLASVDCPVDTLAIVDNGSAMGLADSDDLDRFLVELQACSYPGIESIKVARPFSNIGVAASWNHVLTSFVRAPVVLLVNNDVVFPPGVLSRALAMLDVNRPQFLPFLPEPQQFSVFAITALGWDLVGLFNENFYPAYCEDLDYTERMLECDIETVVDSGLQEEMLSLNHDHSATIRSDPWLELCNRSSYALNYAYWSSGYPRRVENRGVWRRRWLQQWLPEAIEAD